MNSRCLVAVLTLAVGPFLCTPPAQATLNMTTVISAIAQLGDGSTAVGLGHVVIAGTNMNRLVAGGTFNATCASEFTGSIPGQRSLTSEVLATYNQLYVTVPEWVPSYRNMPGFENVPGGSILSCTYAWTSRAQESAYTVGVPGFTVTFGGAEAHDGGSVNFPMYKSAGDGEPSRGCIH